jgi:hypothetical protein
MWTTSRQKSCRQWASLQVRSSHITSFEVNVRLTVSKQHRRGKREPSAQAAHARHLWHLLHHCAIRPMPAPSAWLLLQPCTPGSTSQETQKGCRCCLAAAAAPCSQNLALPSWRGCRCCPVAAAAPRTAVSRSVVLLTSASSYDTELAGSSEWPAACAPLQRHHCCTL